MVNFQCELTNTTTEVLCIQKPFKKSPKIEKASIWLKHEGTR